MVDEVLPECTKQNTSRELLLWHFLEKDALIEISQFCNTESTIASLGNAVNNTIWIKKEGVILLIYPFKPSNVNFQKNVMPKVILAIFCQRKAGPLEPFLP